MPSGFSQDRMGRYYLRTLEDAPGSYDSIQKFRVYAESFSDDERLWFVERFSERAVEEPRWYLPLAALYLAGSPPIAWEDAERSLEIFSEKTSPSLEDEKVFLLLQFEVALERAKAENTPVKVGSFERLEKIADQLLNKLPPSDPLWQSTWLEVFLFAQENQDGDFLQKIVDWAMLVPSETLPSGLRQPLATYFSEQKDNSSARQIWEPLLKSELPDERVEALQALFAIEASEGNFPRAFDLLDEAVGQISQGDSRRAQLYASAEPYAANQQELWRIFLNQVLEQSPGDVAAWLMLATTYKQDFPRRVELLRRALEANSKNAELLQALLEVLDQQGKAAEALAVIDEILEATPDSVEARLQRADFLTRLDRLEDAERSLSELADGSPVDSSQYERIVDTARRFYLQRLLVELLEKMPADSERGVEIFQVRQKLASAEAEVFANAYLDKLSDTAQKFAFSLGIARELFLQKQFSAANSWAKRSLDFAGDNSSREEVIFLITDILAVNNEEAAADWLQGFFVEHPEFVTENLDRRLFGLLKNMDETTPASGVASALDVRNVLPQGEGAPGTQLQNYLRKLHTATEQTSASAADFIRLARWLDWSEQSEKAADVFRQALRRDDLAGSVPLWSAAASLAKKQARYADAVRHYRQLQALDPENDKDYQRALAGVFLANNQPASAVKILKELALAEPKNPEAWRELALAEQEANLYFDAVKSWEEAHRLMMADSEATVGDRVQFLQPLAKIYRRLQRFDDATELYRVALESITDPTVRALLQQEISSDPPELFIVESDEKSASQLSVKTATEALQELRALSDGADSTEKKWENLVRRFPRDPEILDAAIAFFEKQKNFRRAAELLVERGRFMPMSRKDRFRL
ncbi:MAG: tetratricopeptide repeat protein, partial [Chthoniobacterales bacterium]